MPDKITVLVTVPVTVDLDEWRQAYGSDSDEDAAADARQAIPATVLDVTEHALRLQSNGARVGRSAAPSLYSIRASVTRTEGGWQSTIDLPMFYLDPTVQGILSTQHAEKIVKHMLSSISAGGIIHVHAVEV